MERSRALHQMQIILMGNQRKIIAFGGQNNEGSLDSILLKFLMKLIKKWEISHLKLNQRRNNFRNFSCIGIPSKSFLNGAEDIEDNDDFKFMKPRKKLSDFQLLFHLLSEKTLQIRKPLI